MDHASVETSPRSYTALGVLIAAVVLGFVADLLVHDNTLGAGFALFLLVVTATGVAVGKARRIPIGRASAWLVVPIVVFGGMFAWRDADVLKWLNGLCIATLVALMTLRKGHSDLRSGSIFEYTFRLLGEWVDYVAELGPLARIDGGWGQFGRGGSSRTVGAILRGFFLVLPLVFVFGALFMGADAGFEKLVTGMFQFDAGGWFAHAIIIIFYACVVGGVLHRLFLAPKVFPTATVPKRPPLGIVEIGTALFVLDLLFGAFVATQFQHFFGGDQVVQTTANLGYGSYARRGFFELSAVAILSLPVLLGSYQLLRRETPRAMITYRILASVLIVLLFAVISSAWLRMQICVHAYGITQPRLYVFAAIAWMGGVFAWFAATVLRGRPERFAFGALAMFLAGVLSLNVINPDALIARVNTTRPQETMDVAYLSGLGLDAVPSLVASIDRLKDDRRDAVLNILAMQKHDLEKRNARSWNVGVSQASQSLHGVKLPPYVAKEETEGTY